MTVPSIPPPQLRFGVFYDGGWYAHVSDYLAEHSEWRAQPSFRGVHDVLRWYLNRQFGAPLHRIELSQAHYVRGRSTTPSAAFDHALDTAGVVRHDVALTGHGEKGADVHLALETYDQALNTPLDVVALITGDADLLPLVERLHRHGVDVVIPTMNATYTDDDGTGRIIKTAEALAASTPHAPTWAELLAAAFASGYPLSYPFTAPIEAPQEQAPHEERSGYIGRWDDGERYGFITDLFGTSWFASRDELPDGLDHLPAGQRVVFKGRPRPMPGKKYPDARNIRPVGSRLRP